MIKFLIHGIWLMISSIPSLRVAINATQKPPEELGEMLSGIPGNPLSSSSLSPALGPVR